MEPYNGYDEEIKIEEEFYKGRGNAINMALAVENYLEFFISNYFVKPQNSKTFFFENKVVQPLNFLQKINLFKKICQRENFNAKNIKALIKLLNEIRETRNKVAHWETLVDPQKNTITLMKKGEVINPENYLKLDEKMLKDLDGKRFKAITEITEFYLKYAQEGTIDEKWEKKGIENSKYD